MGKAVKENFKSKLNLACSNDDLRPVMQYIIFRNGYVVCTNAYILVKQHLSLHGFTDEEISQMNGKAVHKDTFKEILRYDQVKVISGQFVCSKGRVTVKIDFDRIQGNYPNYEAVIPKGKPEPSVVRLNVKSIALVKDLTVDEISYVDIFTYGEKKGTIFSSGWYGMDKEIIMLMPRERGN